MIRRLSTLLAALVTFGAATTAHAQVFHGTISVNQPGANTPLTLQPGSSGNVSVSNSPNPISGKYFLDFPRGAGVHRGVLITSVAKNGSQNGNFITTAAAHGFSSSNSNQFYISVNTSESASVRGNGDASFAFFYHNDWLCGTMTNDTNGGPATGLIASPGIELDDEFVEPSPPDGSFELTLSDLRPGAGPANGILLVNGAKSEDNYALSRANDDETFDIFCHDNGVNGGGGVAIEQDPVNFVYIDRTDLGKGGLVALGRIKADASSHLAAGPFTVDGVGVARWLLKIPGQTNDTGTLLISPEGGSLFNVDNILSFQWDSAQSGWEIQSRDLPDHQLQNSNNDDEIMFSFAFFEKSDVTVTTLEDQNDPNAFFSTGGEISLREAITQGPDQSVITFDPALSGQTITLTKGALFIDNSLTINANSLPEGITIDANGATTNHRVMLINEGHNVALRGLTLTGGKTPFRGGAIDIFDSNLSLDACTISGNFAGERGGGINNEGDGGNSTLNLNACTLSGNSSGGQGGGIYATGSILNVSNSTLSGNSSSTDGGGIYNTGAGGVLNLSDSILAGNTASGNGPDFQTASSNASGTNLIGDVGNSTLQDNTGLSLIIATADPKLAPLSDYGGPTQTMHPLAGSPAIRTGEDPTTRTDQRGFTLTGTPTIGAVKIGPMHKVRNTADSGFESLRAALINSTNRVGAFICFDQNLSGMTIGLSTQLQIPGSTEALIIFASDLPGGLTIDASQQSRVMEIQPGADVGLYGLTLTGGEDTSGAGVLVGLGAVARFTGVTIHDCEADGPGGAISNRGFSVLDDCTLVNNIAKSEGGGINVRGPGTVELNRCTLSGNDAKSGGALYNRESTLTVTDCTFRDNDGENGGVLYNSAPDGSLTSTSIFHGCSFTDNVASDDGGVLYNRGFGDGALLPAANPVAKFTQSTFTQNRAKRGGVVYYDANWSEGSAVFEDCTMAYNTATTEGGLFRVFAEGREGTVTLLRCTIAQNSSAKGGIAYTTDFFGDPKVTFNSCTIARNSVTSGKLFQKVGGGSITRNHSLVAGNNGSDENTHDDSFLAPLGDYGGPTQTMLLLPGSTAIDAATNSTRTVDQRGFPIFGGTPDVGAVEFQGNSDLAPLWNIDHDGDGNTFGYEFALGTDPFAADPGHPNNPTLVFDPTTGTRSINVGHNPAAIGYVGWIIERSTDHQNWSLFFTTDAPALIQKFDPGTDPRAFYRIGIVDIGS